MNNLGFGASFGDQQQHETRLVAQHLLAALQQRNDRSTSDLVLAHQLSQTSLSSDSSLADADILHALTQAVVLQQQLARRRSSLASSSLPANRALFATASVPPNLRPINWDEERKGNNQALLFQDPSLAQRQLLGSKNSILMSSPSSLPAAFPERRQNVPPHMLLTTAAGLREGIEQLRRSSMVSSMKDHATSNPSLLLAKAGIGHEDSAAPPTASVKTPTYSMHQASRWEQRYRDLLAFRDEYGHCCVPSHWPQNAALAQQVLRLHILFE